MSIHVCKCAHNGREEWHLRYPGMKELEAQALADQINSGAALAATPAATPAQAQPAEANPLTDEKVQAIREEVFAWSLARCDGCDDETWDQWFARAVQRACAEAWGVKLAGIGASTGVGNG